MSRLEDIFAGRMELTATQRGYVLHAIEDLYLKGTGPGPKGVNRRAFVKRIFEKIHALKLERMVTPDGSRLVSIEEHDAIVAKLCAEPVQRYRIDRIYNAQHSVKEAEAPTINEAYGWILERIRLAGKVGLHLRPLDFDVIDTWEQ